MKKYFFLIAMQLFVGGSVFAQNLPGGFQHVIEVGRYSDWNKGYLTITDINHIVIYDGNIAGPYPITYDGAGRAPELGAMILEVDGVSAAGWNKEDFYRAVDGRHDTITLKLRSRNNGQTYEYVTGIVPRYELPDKLKQFGIYASYNDFNKNNSKAAQRKTRLTKDVSFEERHDKDFDFSECHTYDYLITSNDPLLDKELIDISMSFSGMTRDENNPDLLITISRNVNETINSTYIPPSSRTVNTGSTTTARYNYITKTNDYITTQNNRTIQEGGYVKETKTTDIFLEIAALDAKRINDPNLTYPPIVWKATATRHVLNPNFNNTDELKAYASWMLIPPKDRVIEISRSISTPLGVSYLSNNHFILREIHPNSLAKAAGLEPGDKILRVINGNYTKKSLTRMNKDIRKNGWGGVMYYSQNGMDIMVLRSGKRVVIHVPPAQSIKYYRFWWVDTK